MTVLAVSTGWVNYNGVNANVTIRMEGGIEPYLLAELAETTLRTLVFVSECVKRGLREINYEKHPYLENPPDDYHNISRYEIEPRVTTFCDMQYEGFKTSITLHSHTLASDALDVFWARYDLYKSLGLIGSEAAQPPVTSGNSDSPQNASGGELPDGVIIGKMNPSSTKVYYQNGQTVALPINRIKLTFIDGYIYEMWGTNGNGRYPALKIYKTKKGKDENSDSYIAVKDTLEALALSLEGTSEAHGKWWLIGDINHVEKDGTVKEYFNPIGIREQ